MSGSPLRLYGIANCDTVRKARTFLASHGQAVEFHDFKREGVTDAQLRRWAGAVGWERLLNRQGTTWRKLTPSEQHAVVDETSARALMLVATSVIRRPVVEWPDGSVTVGFDEAGWTSRLG